MARLGEDAGFDLQPVIVRIAFPKLTDDVAQEIDAARGQTPVGCLVDIRQSENRRLLTEKCEQLVQARVPFRTKLNGVRQECIGVDVHADHTCHGSGKVDPSDFAGSQPYCAGIFTEDPKPGREGGGVQL